MKQIVPRRTYIEWLDQFRDKNLIKVLTGMRRVGKSTILELYRRHLRKCGISEGRIVSINFEELENSALLSPMKLHEYLVERISSRAMTYIFLDEVQRVRDFERVLDSIYVKKNVDLYVTGSTSNVFSSEIATILTGRYVELNVLPFSFAEMRMAEGGDGASNLRQSFMRYLTYGALPESFSFEPGSAAQREYVESVYRTILEKDVLKRNREGGRLLVSQMVKYFADNIGSLTSAKRIADRLSANGTKVCANTVASYLEILQDCFFLYKADRFDIHGGEYLKLINKYYLTDFGFKYYILDNPTIELQQVLENMVFLELKRRNCRVATGRIGNREVDFVVKDEKGGMQYIQVAVTIAAQEKLMQELAALMAIKDSYPKLILTLDEVFVPNHNGVKTMNVIEWLENEAR